MNREMVDRYCERAIIGLVLAILVFAPLATGAVRSLDFIVVQGLTVVASIAWLVRLWANQRQALIWPPACWCAVAFVAYAAISYSMADVEYTARGELVRVIVYGLLFFLVVNNLTRQEPSQWMLITLIVLGVAVSGYAIYQFASKSSMVWQFVKPLQYGRRAGGTYINPNHLAGFLEMVLPIAISLTLLSRFGHAAKILLGYASLVMVLGICVTISRAGWAAAAMAVTAMMGLFLLRPSLRALSVTLLSIILLGGTVFVLNDRASQERLKDLNQTSHPESRYFFWSSATAMWKDHLWLGGGPGHYDLRYGAYRLPDWQAQKRPVYAHNDYLNTLADWGFVGFSIIAAFVGFTAAGVFRTLPYLMRTPNDLEAKRSTREAVVIGAAFGLLALLVHSIFDFNMQIPANAVVAVALFGLLAGYRRFATDRFWVSPSVLLNLVITIGIVTGIAFLSAAGVRSLRENICLDAAMKLKSSPEKQLVFLKKANHIEPANHETVHQIGEILRLESWKGEDDYEELAKAAMQWFEVGMRLNPHDPSNFARYGMCLDWIGRKKEAGAYFQQAVKLDPNSYYTSALQGWHFVQLEQYETARSWFDRSLQLLNNYKNRNPIAATYLAMVNRIISEERRSRPEPAVQPHDPVRLP